MIEDAYHGTPTWQTMEAELAAPFQGEPGSEGALAHRRWVYPNRQRPKGVGAGWAGCELGARGERGQVQVCVFIE